MKESQGGVVVVGFEDDGGGRALANFDDAREEIGIVEAFRQSRDGHDLRNGAEAVDPGVLEAP